jgi:hypothetical protein
MHAVHLKALSLVKVKVEAKAVPLHAKQARKGDRGIALSILDPGLERG